MNRLFEAYVAAELRKEARILDLRVREQGPRKYFARLDKFGRARFRHETRHLFYGQEKPSRHDRRREVEDTRRSREKLREYHRPICIRLEATPRDIKVKSLALLYPLQEKLTKPVYLTLEGTGATLLVQPIRYLRKKELLAQLWARAILSFLSSSFSLLKLLRPEARQVPSEKSRRLFWRPRRQLLRDPPTDR